MSKSRFNRDSLARWYAKEHLKTDPGVTAVYYLPDRAPEREIRFLEINELMGDRNDSALQPIDFGVDTGTENEHKLLVIDVTPDQWKRITANKLRLPDDWSLEHAKHFAK